MSYKLLYLPIETKDRELLGKLLLATTLAEKGWLVFLGRQSALLKLTPCFLPGVFSHISIPEHAYERYIVPFSEKGIKSVCMCEEGLMYEDGEDYCNRKVGIGALSLTEKFFAVGDRQLMHVKRFRNTSDSQAVIVGNPRFDVLRERFRAPYASSARSIYRKYKKYILINTNFSMCNPHKGYGDRLRKMKKNKSIASKKQESLWFDRLAYQESTMSHFQNLISRLSREFEDCTIVIRPHPSENHSTWSDFAKEYPNVIVSVKNSANAWMLGAEVVIHNGCTTGIEGVLLGSSVIAYVPDPDSGFAANPANSVSFRVHDDADVIDAVARVLNGLTLDNSFSCETKRSRLKNYIQNVDGPFSCSMIADQIDAIYVPAFGLEEIKNRLSKNRKTASLTMRRPYSFARKFFLRLCRVDDTHSVTKQKFQSLSFSEITEPLMTWYESKAITSIPNVDAAENDLFFIYRKHI